MIMNAGFGIFSQISSLNDLDELRVLVSLYARVSREWHYNAAILKNKEFRHPSKFTWLDRQGQCSIKNSI